MLGGHSLPCLPRATSRLAARRTLRHMDRFDDVIGRGRGSDRPEPGVIGQLQQLLNTHEPAGYWWEREATRLTHGWGMTVATISADLVQVWRGLERVTLAPGTDGHWRRRS
jgi:hypothetical protein